MKLPRRINLSMAKCMCLAMLAQKIESHILVAHPTFPEGTCYMDTSLIRTLSLPFLQSAGMMKTGHPLLKHMEEHVLHILWLYTNI